MYSEETAKELTDKQLLDALNKAGGRCDDSQVELLLEEVDRLRRWHR